MTMPTFAEIRVAQAALAFLTKHEIIDEYGCRKLLRKMASNPAAAIHTALAEFIKSMGFYFFPSSENEVPSDGEAYCTDIIDRLPGEAFKSAAMGEPGFEWSRFFESLKNPGYSAEMDHVFQALGAYGLAPLDAEWWLGAEARLLGIPRLGRQGAWGQGWLFAHAGPIWEGSICTYGFMTKHTPLMSPSEWRWALKNGHISGAWNEHDGRHGKWNWEAIDAIRPRTEPSAIEDDEDFDFFADDDDDSHRH